MTEISSVGWFPNLDKAIGAGDVKAFPTKKAALSAAKTFGWRNVLRVNRRFEKAYIIGKLDFQDDLEGDVEFVKLRVPALRWELNDANVKYQPVISFRRPKGADQ